MILTFLCPRFRC